MKILAPIIIALALAGCACQHPPGTHIPTRPTFLRLDFTDAGLEITHDEADALEWAKSDEALVIDLVKAERIYPDGSREPVRAMRK